MKMIVVALLVTVAAVAFAEDGYGYRGHYQPGFKHVHEGVAAAYRNDVRQEHVNHVAEHYGSGTGTARFVGVPGTNNYFGYRHNSGYGYPHGGYGGYNGGYGY